MAVGCWVVCLYGRPRGVVGQTQQCEFLIGEIIHTLCFCAQQTIMQARLTPRLVTLQGNKSKEGIHLVVPPEFANFFIASASAGGALVGLLFVAVSVAPEQIVAAQAPVERQAVASTAFTALMNAFFISLFALIPKFNIGFIIIPFSFLCLLTVLIQAWRILRGTRNWQSLLRRAFLVLLSVALYGLELWNGFQLYTNPSQPGYVYSLISCLLGAFGLGLIRAWELLGVRRYGLLGWLNPLRDIPDTESFSHTGNSHTTTEHPTFDEAAPRSPTQ